MHQRLREVVGDDPPDERAALRVRILDAAADHFTRFGYRKASIAEIARGAGIGKGTIYLHFDSKQTLLVAAIAREKLALIPSMERIFALPQADQLRAYLRLVLGFSVTAPLSNRLLRGDRELEALLTALGPEYQQDRSRGHALIRRFLAPVAPDLSDERADELVRLITALPVAVSHLVDTPSLTDHNVEAAVALLADVLATGLEHR